MSIKDINLVYKIRLITIFFLIFSTLDLISSILFIDGVKIIELNVLVAESFYAQNYIFIILFKWGMITLTLLGLEFLLSKFHILTSKNKRFLYRGFFIAVSILMGFVINNFSLAYIFR